MKVNDFVTKVKDAATKYKTLYVYGCFGAPLNDKNKKRYCNNTDYNKNPTRTKMIMAASADTFGFDCVCFIKGILWGWNGDKTKTYGGAIYASNGVPDISANSFFKTCTNISTDFSKIQVGEAVWIDGHIGVYIGNGQVVECTPKFENKVQITNLANVGNNKGNYRTWIKHGKIKFIDYTEEKPVKIFFPAKGYFKTGDTHANVGKIAKFLYDKFPQFTPKAALGNYYGPNITKAVKEFQKFAKTNGQYNDVIDGYTGPKTLKALEYYGFKY